MSMHIPNFTALYAANVVTLFVLLATLGAVGLAQKFNVYLAIMCFALRNNDLKFFDKTKRPELWQQTISMTLGCKRTTDRYLHRGKTTHKAFVK